MGKKIKWIIAEISRGAGQVLVISPDREYDYPSKTSFLTDNAKLRLDTKKVGDDLKITIKKQYSDVKSSY